jgi:hypothetical protein
MQEIICMKNREVTEQEKSIPSLIEALPPLIARCDNEFTAESAEAIVRNVSWLWSKLSNEATFRLLTLPKEDIRRALPLLKKGADSIRACSERTKDKRQQRHFEKLLDGVETRHRLLEILDREGLLKLDEAIAKELRARSQSA